MVQNVAPSSEAAANFPNPHFSQSSTFLPPSRENRPLGQFLQRTKIVGAEDGGRDGEKVGNSEGEDDGCGDGGMLGADVGLLVSHEVDPGFENFGGSQGMH